MSAAFPLILTFSLREKEQQLSIFFSAMIDRAAGRLQFAKTLEAILPLPKGAATAAMAGEGKVTIQLFNAGR